MFREEFGPVHICKHVRYGAELFSERHIQEEFGPVHICKDYPGRVWSDVQRRVRPRTCLKICTGPNSSLNIQEEFGTVQIVNKGFALSGEGWFDVQTVFREDFGPVQIVKEYPCQHTRNPCCTTVWMYKYEYRYGTKLAYAAITSLLLERPSAENALPSHEERTATTRQKRMSCPSKFGI